MTARHNANGFFAMRTFDIVCPFPHSLFGLLLNGVSNRFVIHFDLDAHSFHLLSPKFYHGDGRRTTLTTTKGEYP